MIYRMHPVEGATPVFLNVPVCLTLSEVIDGAILERVVHAVGRHAGCALDEARRLVGPPDVTAAGIASRLNQLGLAPRVLFSEAGVDAVVSLVDGSIEPLRDDCEYVPQSISMSDWAGQQGFKPAFKVSSEPKLAKGPSLGPSAGPKLPAMTTMSDDEPSDASDTSLKIGGRHPRTSELVVHASDDPRALNEELQKALPLLTEALRSIAAAVPGARFAHDEQAGGMCWANPMQDGDMRAQTQAPSTISDLLNGQISTDDADDIDQIADKVGTWSGLIPEEGVSDTMDANEGFRGRTMMVQIPGTQVSARIEIAPHEMIAAKQQVGGILQGMANGGSSGLEGHGQIANAYKQAALAFMRRISGGDVTLPEAQPSELFVSSDGMVDDGDMMSDSGVTKMSELLNRPMKACRVREAYVAALQFSEGDHDGAKAIMRDLGIRTILSTSAKGAQVIVCDPSSVYDTKAAKTPELRVRMSEFAVSSGMIPVSGVKNA